MGDLEQLAVGQDSIVPAPTSSPKPAQFDSAELLTRIWWTVPEAAFQLRVAVRTVWRMLSDPKSRFPRPRRLRGRTLLARDEVLAFMQREGSR